MNGTKKNASIPMPEESNGFLTEHARRLIQGYRHWTGRDLVNPELSPLGQARALFEAPFVTAAHGTEADPVFNYANRAALTLFETTWVDFTSMPSRLSAEVVVREERAQLLARVHCYGFIDDYSGIRISAHGHRFRIQRATLWNVVDAHGAPGGQAVVFHNWEHLEDL